MILAFPIQHIFPLNLKVLKRIKPNNQGKQFEVMSLILGGNPVNWGKAEQTSLLCYGRNRSYVDHPFIDTCDIGPHLSDRVRSVSINMLLIAFKHTYSVYYIYIYMCVILF